MSQAVLIALANIVGAGLFWLGAVMIITAMGKYRREAEADRKASILLYESNLRVLADNRSCRAEAAAAAVLAAEMAADRASHVAQFVQADPPPTEASA